MGLKPLFGALPGRLRAAGRQSAANTFRRRNIGTFSGI